MLGENPHVVPVAFWSSRWSCFHGLSPYARQRSRASTRSANGVVGLPASTTRIDLVVFSASDAAISAAVMPLPTMTMSALCVIMPWAPW